ncbi:MAG: hypothetical protein ACJ71B_01575 [Nitrososphaera sp.]
MRNKLSISLAFSGAILLLLLASSLPLSNILQQVQAQSSLSFRTTEPASGFVECSHTAATLTFDAQGTNSSSNLQRVNITGGTFQINSTTGGEELHRGNIHSGRFSSSSVGGGLFLNAEVNDASEVDDTSTCASTGDSLTISTPCSTSNVNAIALGILGQDLDGFGTFSGAVDCPQVGGGGTQSMAASSQNGDGDGDGIPYSSYRCLDTSNPRCFKEGDTSSTTQQQQQPSSSNRTGNQTR